VNDNDDSPAAVFWGGVVAPGALLSLILFNLVTRKAYWLNARGPDPIAVFTGLWPVTGTVLVELGFGGVLCSWYLLSNLEQTQRWAWLAMVSSVVVAASGFVAFLGSVL
jgi:hypothetical protein